MRRKGRTGSATNLYLDDVVKKAAAKLAFDEGKSLSDLVTEELKKLLAKRSRVGASR